MFPKKKVNKQKLWAVYLHSLNAFNEKVVLNDKDIHVFSTILSLLDTNEYNIKWFSKPYTDILSNKIDNASYAEIYRVLRNLIKVHLVTVTDNKEDKRKRDYKLSLGLISAKNFFDKQIATNTINISLPLELYD